METKSTTWLKDNIAAVIAITWISFTIFVYIVILISPVKSNDNTTFLIINSVTNIVLLIVGYYFGSSIGSKGKDEQIKTLTDAADKTVSNKTS